jgi:hypothetical protein
MQTWVWGEHFPDAMDALAPVASMPVQISGRNLISRLAQRRLRLREAADTVGADRGATVCGHAQQSPAAAGGRSPTGPRRLPTMTNW